MYIVGDNKAVFLHIPKSAGTWLEEVLGPITTVAESHMPMARIPVDIPRFLFVRNPIDWYLSWYKFFNHPNRVNQVMQAIGKGKDFQEVLAQLLNPSVEMRTEALNACRNDIVLVGGNNSALIKDWRDNEGYYSLFVRHYGYGATAVGRVESIREDVRNMLASVDMLTPEMEERIYTIPPLNVDDYDSAEPDYTDEMRQAVYKADRWIFERWYPDVAI